MMRAPLIAIALSIVSGAVGAQPAREDVTSLERCFQLARSADTVCYDPTNDPVQRLDCLQKARTAQLQCLEHVPSGKSARFAAPEAPPETVAPELPNTVSPETPSARALPEASAGSLSPARPSATVSTGGPTGSPKTSPGAIPPKTPTADLSPDKPTGTILPSISTGMVDIPARPSNSNWVISETTSPVDYSPLLTALIHSTFRAKDAANTLVFRCRGLRTDLQVHTEGTWRASRTGEVQVDYQVNDQPFIRRHWTMSADGKTATFTDDAAVLLRSLPEGALLKIRVSDGSSPSHETAFQVVGLEKLRRKFGMVCKWPPAEEKTSSGKP
jgi:hypothetical protein